MPRANETRRCPVCGKGLLRLRVADEQFDYPTSARSKVRVKAPGVPAEVCDHCGESFHGPEAALIHNRAIGRALGLLSPEEIQAIRKRWGLSMSRFAAHTGIDKTLLLDWEKGRLLPSRAFDNYLRLLDAPKAKSLLKQRAG